MLSTVVLLSSPVVSLTSSFCSLFSNLTSHPPLLASPAFCGIAMTGEEAVLHISNQLHNYHISCTSLLTVSKTKIAIVVFEKREPCPDGLLLWRRACPDENRDRDEVSPQHFRSFE